MATFISLLRGINVSGQKKINMQELKALYEELSFRNVKTYIQSGNVVFEAGEKNTAKLAKIIEQGLLEKYAFQVSVIVRTDHELAATLADNPFLPKEDINESNFHVTFLQQLPLTENVKKLEAYNFEPDQFRLLDKVVYLFCPNGYGRTKLTNTFFENKLKVIATTRNWRTLKELTTMTGRQ
jgi:uncharacterized protein (DUF1697 family)